MAAEELLDVDALAAALGISRWTIYRWSTEGRIPCIRAGRKIRFILSDVVAALKDPGCTASLPSHTPPPPPTQTPEERLRAAGNATRVLRGG